jgi:nicotinamide-nucleotide amidase
MIARLISIGTELALGQTVDTNSAWLAQQLARAGIVCDRHVTVGDDRSVIAQIIRESAAAAPLVIITGGLGPTPDDLTRESLADVLSAPLELHESMLSQIEEFFRQRGRTMHDRNRVQAMIPVGAVPIENLRGTAPGISARIGDARIFALPGVPDEMRAMFERSVWPRIVAAADGRAIVQRVIHSFGMSESEIGHRIADLMERGRNPSVGTSAADLIISIRINAAAAPPDEAARLADSDAAEVRSRLGHCIFGEGEQSLATAVAQLLIGRGATVATAESCTGGLIATRLTDVPGSSAYFVQGLVTYANEAKERLLGVAAGLLREHGAVSEPVAEAMADRCRKISGTDYALSVTGIAGPTGATADKPIGLVYVALAGPAGVKARELRLGATLTRAQVRDRAAKAALNMLRLQLLA